MLKTQFIQNTTDVSNVIWNDSHYMFNDNKNYFEYNTTKLKDIGTPIVCIKALHNCVQAAKRDSSEANNM